MKGRTVDLTEYRTIQFFLSPANSQGPGIYEVMAYKNKDFVCDCPGFVSRNRCKHINFVKNRIEDNEGTYPLEISTRVSREEAETARESQEAFRKFLMKYGKIEVF